MVRNRDAFTATTDLIDAFPGAYIHKLVLALKGDMTAAASVSVETFLGVLSTIEVRLFGSPVIMLSATDLLAYNALALNKTPLTIVATAATDAKTQVYGLELPLYQPARGRGDLAYKFEYTAVSGVDTETITVKEVRSDKVLQTGYLHAVRVPATTAAATGWGNIHDFTAVGDLQGILIFSTTIPTATAVTATTQELRVYLNEELKYECNWDDLAGEGKAGAGIPTHDSPADYSILDNYRYLSFEEDPVSKGTRVKLDFYAGVANEAYRFIPVYRVRS